MILKMNMREVRLAATGKHLFDAPYAYRERFEIDGIVIEHVNRVYLASADLNEEQRQRLLHEIETTNAEQEQEWEVNQPLPRFP